MYYYFSGTYSLHYYPGNAAQHTRRGATHDFRNIYKNDRCVNVVEENFSNAFNLRKPFKCPYCSKTFYQSFEVKRHIRVHTGEKPYECEVCQKRFNQLCNLKRHIRVHSG